MHKYEAEYQVTCGEQLQEGRLSLVAPSLMVASALFMELLAELYPGKEVCGLKCTESLFLRRVLLVDDDDALCSLLAQNLREQSYYPTVAQDGREALDKLSKQEFDLVITDIRMPGITGVTLLKSLRAEKNLQIPVIALTGFAEEAADEKYRFNAIISKPIRGSEFIEKLRDFAARYTVSLV